MIVDRRCYDSAGRRADPPPTGATIVLGTLGAAGR
jgi:hypothetical protein